MNGPTLSKKLRSENKKYHSSIAVVLFVVFVTVTVSIFFIAIKGIFDKNDNTETQQGDVTQESTPEDNQENNETTTEETTYTVKAGDTLYAIGMELGVNWEEIAEVNNIEAPYSLSTGQELTIPQSKDNSNNNLEVQE